MIPYFGSNFDKIRYANVIESRLIIAEHTNQDVEIAKEIGLKKITIDLLTSDLENLEDYLSATILEEPVVGIVYKTKGQKKFSRVEESLKYPNDTKEYDEVC